MSPELAVPFFVERVVCFAPLDPFITLEHNGAAATRRGAVLCADTM